MLAKIVLVVLLFAFGEASEIDSGQNLEVLIQKMKEADKSQKYIYMNKIKKILRTMSLNERAKIISSLKKGQKANSKIESAKKSNIQSLKQKMKGRRH